MRRKGLAARRARPASAGRRLSAGRDGRVDRRRGAGQSRSPGARIAMLAQSRPSAHICTPAEAASRLARARVRARRHGLRARRARPLGRLGRRRRSSRTTRRLSAPHHHADGRVRLPQPALRPLRPGLRPHAHQLRLPLRKGLRNFREFIDRAADVVLSFGGSLSGEHGDGQARAALLPKMFGPELMQAFREFKALWDPDNRMNPGKLVDAVRVYDPLENLRHLRGANCLRPSSHDENAEGASRTRREALKHDLRAETRHSGSPRPHFCLRCDRRRLARARHRALRRRRRMPQGRWRRHVPQLPRHRRGAALHPRPRPPAVGDAGRRSAQ